MTHPFALGVNYWPRRKAMYWWSDFDPGEVRDDFALLQALGFDCARVFLLWDDFQPEPDLVSRAALDHLAQVCDLAQAHGLRLNITFFTGHMSGPNWAPRWLLGGPRRAVRASQPLGVAQVVSRGRLTRAGYRNPYTDPLALAAERLLLRTVVGALKDHPAVWLWNLGNEPDIFAWPPNAAVGAAWVRALADLIRSLAPQPVTCGLHVDSLHRDNGLRVHQVFDACDLAVMHAYPMYLPWARHPLDPDVVPYTCALTAALSGKPVLMEEFGGCTAPPGQPSQYWTWTAAGLPFRQFMASEEALARYLEQVLPRLVQVGALGALVWCFADYAQELWDRPPCRDWRHERHFGLVRPDGSLKPHAAVLQRFAATRPQVQRAAPARLPITPETFYRFPIAHLLRLYPRYLALSA